MGRLTGRDIVCLSTHYWHERRFRKQEFMARFARENRVLFVEPSFPMVRRPERHLREFATNRRLATRVEQVESNLYLLKPPQSLPKSSLPAIEPYNYGWWGRGIGRAVRRLGFEDAIVWLYRPAFAAALNHIPHAGIAFDLVDDLAAYHGAHTSHVERQLADVVGRSDLLVVTAQPLADRYGAGARRIVHVPNGFDAERWAPAPDVAPPAALAQIPRPILGFVGTLFAFLDFELLEAVARRHADKSMVLVGPIEAHAAEAVARLVALPNVHHVGSQPQAAIPAFVREFAVCLNPFVRGRVADSVSPLKVYEYLAAGRPVISSPMKALQMEEAGRVVAFGEDAAQFAAEVDRCLSPEVQQADQARRAAVAGYSWDALFERVDAACEAAFASRSVARAHGDGLARR